MATFKSKSIRPMNPSELRVSPELEEVQEFMPISAEDRDRLKKDIQESGEIRDPLKIYFDNEGTPLILGGMNRWEIAQELGFDFVPVEVISLSAEKRRTLALMDNLARRQLSRDQKNKIVEIFLKTDPEESNRVIATKTGVDHKTVGQLRTRLASTGEIPQLEKRKGADGKVRTAEPVKKVKVTVLPAKKTSKQPSYAKRIKSFEQGFKREILEYVEALSPSDLKQFKKKKKKYIDSLK